MGAIAMEYTLEIIDHMTKHFTDYIDSGFGLLRPDVAYLTTVLVTIDIVIAGLFRALLNDQYMPNNLIQKTLYIGFFAFILNNYQDIANIIYLTFAQLGVKAGQATFDGSMLLKPAFIAETGIKTGGRLLKEASSQFFSWSLGTNQLSALVLVPAGLFVIVAFLILSVHLFIAIIAFKLTTLVGFILVPFALFGKTTFLAERVLSAVMNAGIKLMVIGIVAGIGSSIFKTFVIPGEDISLEQAASAVLASLAILCLSYAISDLVFSIVTGVPVLGTGPAARAANTIREIGRSTVTVTGGAIQAASYLGGRVSGSFQNSQNAQNSMSTMQGSILQTSQAPHRPTGNLNVTFGQRGKGDL